MTLLGCVLTYGHACMIIKLHYYSMGFLVSSMDYSSHLFAALLYLDYFLALKNFTFF